jgi:uncharacterized protein YbjT (DUF2867 family)
VKILVTGATGYIGGRLISRLLQQGHDVRIFVRDSRRISGRSWVRSVEIVTGDLLNAEAVTHALDGVDAAYYLVHSMVGSTDFARRDRRAAFNFALAAQDLKHVIYLGGLLPRTEEISEHLRSRSEVGFILRAYCRTTEFRAGPIIGSGSASFEMVRYLTERLPVMIVPKRILNDVQPIAVRDIMAYLVQALDQGPSGVVEVGSEIMPFKDMMEVYAEVRDLKRWIIPIHVPIWAPGIAARWVALVTPITNTLAVPLVEGIIHPVIGNTTRAQELFPEIKPISYRQAVELALRRIQTHAVETRWSGALGSTSRYELSDERGLMRETRAMYSDLPIDAIFKSFSTIGGERGWLTWQWAWAIRGLSDQLVGGPGLRRGRRDSVEVLPGEALDFWRVEAVEPPTLMRLRAEMKVPGHAWLQWEAVPDGSGTRLVQTAAFAPTGILGVLYWYSLYPIHQVIFSAMLQAIIDDAEEIAHNPNWRPS